MNVWFEDLKEVCSWLHTYTQRSDRATIIAECLDWCHRKGYKFIQADFEHEVFYYEEN